MSRVRVEPARPFDLTIDQIAPDKSISHRAAIFSLLSDRPSRITNFLRGEDTLNTLTIVGKLGASIEDREGVITITPPERVGEPDDILDCGNSGTGMRLFSGFLSTLDGFFVLTGDRYLRNRPMGRVVTPLRMIGAQIDGREGGEKAPLAIRGRDGLEPFNYRSPIASAQVKSALILAALRGKGESSYWEPELSRDHTERMLQGMGAPLSAKLEEGGGYRVHIRPLTAPLDPLTITIPADPSSAFFFAVAAAIVPGSQVTLKNLTLNPTRIEAYRVLQRMGAQVEFIERENLYEPIGDIVVRHAPLHAVSVEERISWLIDELPALAIAMAVAEGESRVSHAQELRVKESDRIRTVVENLRRCGVEVEEFEDGYSIKGGTLKRGVVDSFGDHRIAMAFLIGGLLNGMEVEDTDCIATSFPNFLELLSQMSEVHIGD
ncbi:MAG: 3-phosphoshikimate 1-carboxyvinyltransferase [Epsilonproteobacteria bacterium]|nr:3-phosphoshikimate 1-carboxyvinyltransferase [Campylobacterota bacterium]NPA56146.1 3-phosphoshikimate 1-carboxyvinyltransferase [Campylobacterota bacterium]